MLKESVLEKAGEEASGPCGVEGPQLQEEPFDLAPHPTSSCRFLRDLASGFPVCLSRVEGRNLKGLFEAGAKEGQGGRRWPQSPSEQQRTSVG